MIERRRIQVSSARRSPSGIVKTPKRKQRKTEGGDQKTRRLKQPQFANGQSAAGAPIELEAPQSPQALDIDHDTSFSPELDNLWGGHASASDHAGPATGSNSALLPAKFVKAVFDNRCRAIQLMEGLFVFNGWDAGQNTPIVCTRHAGPILHSDRDTPLIQAQWHHVQAVPLMDIYVCTCSAFCAQQLCVHVTFLRVHGFPDNGDLDVTCCECSCRLMVVRELELTCQFSLCKTDVESNPILFDRYPTVNSDFLNIFSVPARSMPMVRNRAIVEYKGSDNADGVWRCSKDPSDGACYHTAQAKKFMEEKLGMKPGSQDTIQFAGQSPRLWEHCLAATVHHICQLHMLTSSQRNSCSTSSSDATHVPSSSRLTNLGLRLRRQKDHPSVHC